MYTLNEISKKLGLKFSGNGNLKIECVCGLENLKKGGVAFISDINSISSAIPSKKRVLKKNKNAEKIVVVVNENFTKHSLNYNLIYSKDPLVTHIEITNLLYPLNLQNKKIEKSASIDKNVTLGKNVSIGANAVLYAGVKIGKNSTIFAGVVIMKNSTIGENCIIYPNVVIRDNCHIGNSVTLHPNSVIGADGHGYFKRNGLNCKIPQVGKVIIEDDVEIGACTCIDRGRLENTIIRKGTKIDNLVQIAHNVEIGENALISGQSGIGGSTKIGKNLILGAQSGIKDNIELGDNLVVAGKSGVISKPKDTSPVSGIPAVSIKKWYKQIIHLNNLDKLFEKVKKIEKK